MYLTKHLDCRKISQTASRLLTTQSTSHCKRQQKQVRHNKRFLYIRDYKLESLLYSKYNRNYFYKDELKTNSRTGNTNAQNIKKYKEKIAKEIGYIKQRELDQVVSSLNSSLIIQLNFNVF